MEISGWGLLEIFKPEMGVKAISSLESSIFFKFFILLFFHLEWISLNCSIYLLVSGCYIFILKSLSVITKTSPFELTQVHVNSLTGGFFNTYYIPIISFAPKTVTCIERRKFLVLAFLLFFFGLESIFGIFYIIYFLPFLG